jgi:hypothetical protein
VLATAGATFIVVSALLGAWLESAAARSLCGVAAAFAVPLLLRWRIRVLASRTPLREDRIRARISGRSGPRLRLGGAWLLVAYNAALVALLCLGFSESVGRAMRRRGDWFLGESDGYLSRRYRAALAATSGWMERFDLPPEIQPLLAEAALPQEPQPPAPLPGGSEPQPPRPQPQPVPEPPLLPAWFHPLRAPRTFPPNAACRFGAPRPGVRPAECELGHCGIDLVQREGSPVHAVYDGVVLKVVRDELAGGIAGRFVMLTHKSGALQTSYIHLQDIRPDLRPGLTVRGGELVGTLGRTGARRSGPHLHFALAVRQGGRMRYIDPEPLIGKWRLVSPPAIASRRDYSPPSTTQPVVVVEL